MTHDNSAHVTTATKALAVFGLVVLGVTIVPLVVLLVLSTPDIIRYLRIYRM